ncbi:hypothetical protein FE257_006062 [Aspergillus nanangensis]|uniref:Uncharacterized protein n=1 Tax=Aspergillus nanangensis TaxID=2582783 RepID=A0AAD4CPQ6_ASPNN|nr:hypothetical protein FE257_006062 [Aspergillus nanangensis]
MVRSRGSRVYFSNTSRTSQPFQLYRLEDFRLSHTISNTCVPFDLIKQVLHSDRSIPSNHDDGSTEDSDSESAKGENMSIFQRRQDLMKRNSIFLLLRSGERIVDGMPRCEYQTCPLPKAASSRYCQIHSTEILRIASNMDRRRTPVDQRSFELRWELSLAEGCDSQLKLLKSYLIESPSCNWIIDFEFLSIREKSPIPIQVSIRQLDGQLLLSTNVDYDMSLAQVIEVASPYTGANMGPFLMRVYGSYRTNGLQPSEIQARIVNMLKYDPAKTNIFCWYSAQDMQCFQRILTGANEVIVERQDHLSCRNFNIINIATLCQKLLPSAWPSMALEIVHAALLQAQSKEVNISLYHNANYDTQAVADIVKAMVELVY